MNDAHALLSLRYWPIRGEKKLLIDFCRLEEIHQTHLFDQGGRSDASFWLEVHFRPIAWIEKYA